VKFDPFVMALQHGTTLQDLTLELCDYDDNGNVIKVQHRGAWLLVDNGYHQWSMTIPPIKMTTLRTEIRFSQWLESMRKDVECTFGTLKGRWRILKAGVRLFRLKDADRIRKTCCALHNMLLETDGLDDKWEDGVVSEWQCNMGEHDDTSRIPQAIRRLLSPAQARNFDTSGMGTGTDRVADNGADDAEDNNGADDAEDAGNVEVDLMGHIVVKSLSLNQFRSRLIRHFNIAFKRREVKWPKRNGPIRLTV